MTKVKMFQSHFLGDLEAEINVYIEKMHKKGYEVVSQTVQSISGIDLAVCASPVQQVLITVWASKKKDL